MCLVLSGSSGGPERGRWQAEGSLVSDGAGLECEELLGSRGPAVGGAGQLALIPSPCLPYRDVYSHGAEPKLGPEVWEPQQWHLSLSFGALV